MDTLYFSFSILSPLIYIFYINFFKTGSFFVITVHTMESNNTTIQTKIYKAIEAKNPYANKLILNTLSWIIHGVAVKVAESYIVTVF